ncbi:PilZ domain-containing protein [Silanimonas lenta]|jgi:hypothetical protein|uniref:PilZ domain-containing protein n=1 Tax=Silanimonas lenta TaxID=265429 RepID=UPI000421BA27|nr:PilZ domain-containing protein [Silanimonas lenta]
MSQHNEYRRAKRRRATLDIAVIDAMTDQVVGKIGNLSESGVLLILGAPPCADALYQFRFDLPVGTGRPLEVEVGAHELWQDDAAAPGQVWAGFRFIDVSANSLANIRQWVEQPGSDYV